MNNKKGMKELVRSEIKDSLNNVITRETSNGKNVYKDKNGKTIEVCPNELSMIVACGFEPLEMFLDIPVESSRDGDEVRIIAEALVKRAKGEIEEAVNYIEENYGMINLERVIYNQGVEDGKILGIEFKPAEK